MPVSVSCALPTFTPFTRKPDLLNRAEVAEALARAYPKDLREARIGGRAHVWVFIEADGTLSRVQLAESSNNDAIDAAALEVANTFRFSSALNGDEPVPVWIKIPIVFSPIPGLPAQREGGVDRQWRLPESRPLEAAPSFTPFTQQPELTNREDIADALRNEYPPLLKSAGIGGRAMVWVLIDETGDVVKTQLNEPSGYDALDQAALRVVAAMKFKPAENRGRAVPVWISLPVVFQSAGQP